MGAQRTFPLRFLFASQPKIMGKVLGGVYRTLAMHLDPTRPAPLRPRPTLVRSMSIQRFGSALNLNIHFHMLFLDGVYVDRAGSAARFR